MIVILVVLMNMFVNHGGHKGITRNSNNGRLIDRGATLRQDNKY